VNFWQPSGSREFKVLQPGEPFLFKLHSPDNFIVGSGFYVRYSPHNGILLRSDTPEARSLLLVPAACGDVLEKCLPPERGRQTLLDIELVQAKLFQRLRHHSHAAPASDARQAMGDACPEQETTYAVAWFRPHKPADSTRFPTGHKL
jgi:hypothetical protein